MALPKTNVTNLTSELTNLAAVELRAEVAAIHRIATAIAIETPGFGDKFRLPKVGDQKLLAAGRSFAEDAAPLSAVFIDHALPDDFINVLNSTIQNFEEAVNASAEATRARDAAAAAIEATLQKALAASKLLDAIVRNSLRDDPTQLADWDRACHSGIRRKKADTPTPPVATA